MKRPHFGFRFYIQTMFCLLSFSFAHIFLLIAIEKMLVGHLDTKPDKAREVLEDEVKDFASNNGISYIEVSAKTGKNVEDAFLTLAKEVYVTQSRIQDEPETYVPIVPQASSSSIRGGKKNGKCCR
jgi:GTPase SAR1 family protein